MGFAAFLYHVLYQISSKDCFRTQGTMAGATAALLVHDVGSYMHSHCSHLTYCQVSAGGNEMRLK